ncbi:MAG: homoserine O-succinyltransferase [Clostridia bacterium]
MPIIIPKRLPAHGILANENIFVMSKVRANKQDIRPIEILILNLMPTKIDTETQLMRLLGNSPLQINVTLLTTSTYQGKNVSAEHLETFYKTFDQIEDKHFDGMIITGAPVETLEYEDVLYWNELKNIMDFAEKMVTSTIFICWGAQAGLKHYYNIDKILLKEKQFGIFPNYAVTANDPLLKGMDDDFYIPFSRHTTVDEKQIFDNTKLQVLAYSKDVGVSIVKSKDNKKFFFLGHSEYDRETLRKEYMRDIDKGLQINKPKNYFSDGDVDSIKMLWKSTANLLYYNWLNYYVYQVTPFDFKE